MTPDALPAASFAALAAAGVLQCWLGVAAVASFAARARDSGDTPLPPVTILKPLHGDEPLLEEALESFFCQDYPQMQLVFGVHSPADPAICVVRALRQRYPAVDASLVIDGAIHGVNRKISNMINMMGAARHGVLVLADSDVHAAPDYLRRLVATLARPGTGVATTLYAGRAAHRGIVPRLGSSYISHVFLPGALLARALGRQDCLGATMALKRETLDRVGGFASLVDHLADDAVLGQLVRRQGLAVRLAGTVPDTTVPERRWRALFRHELRWARTIRSLVPLAHALSSIQFPIAWALLAVLAGALAPASLRFSLPVLAVSWATRTLAARMVDALLARSDAQPLWSMPLRDIMCVAGIVVSFRGGRVDWRGQSVPVGRPLLDVRPPAAPARAAEPALGGETRV